MSYRLRYQGQIVPAVPEHVRASARARLDEEAHRPSRSRGRCHAALRLSRSDFAAFRRLYGGVPLRVR